MDATALAAAIVAGRLAASDAMEAALAAATSLDRFGAVVRLDPAMGRAGAVAADALQTVDRGPLHGVPFLAKDLGTHAAGLAPAAGSSALRRRIAPPSDDSLLFARFRKAGLVPFGLTTVPEFGLALTSEPNEGPVARNPWDEGLSPGGSSGGAGAAVTAGIVAIAHATDAAGSIRVPAACCGLVGLKTSRGVIPAGPDFTNDLMGLVSELVLARSVRDVAAAFEAAAGRTEGPYPEAAQAPLPERPRIAVMVTTRAAPAQAEAARAVGKALAASGCAVREISPEALDALGERAGAVTRTILSTGLAHWLDTLEIEAEEVSHLAAAVADEGRQMPASALFDASREAARVAHAVWILFHESDVILTPVLADRPPRLGHFDMTGRDPAAHFAGMEALAPNAALANVAGVPALVLPGGRDHRGLPVGVQLMGPMGSDRALLALASRVEEALPRLTFPFPIAGLPQ